MKKNRVDRRLKSFSDLKMCGKYPVSIRDFEKYVKNIVCECAPGGGYALGCGNTAANYIRPENYLMMFNIGRRYGRYPLRC